MNNTVFEINGKSYELDIADVETMERYDAAFEAMKKRGEAITDLDSPVAIMRAYCENFVKLYDDLFGEGAGKEILGDKLNTTKCDETYAEFLDFVRTQKEESINRRASIIAYTPNRRQRRAKR